MCMLPQVKKRDGSVEKFSVINLSKVLIAAGVSADQTKQIVEQIKVWAEQLGVEEISSLEIRDKVLEVLPKVNQNAANLYTWYEQTKES
jgi:transcriptional regulator NrdR family protein